MSSCPVWKPFCWIHVQWEYQNFAVAEKVSQGFHYDLVSVIRSSWENGMSKDIWCLPMIYTMARVMLDALG